MKKALILTLAAAATISAVGVALADEPSISLTAPKMAEAIKVDGVLNDAGWVTVSARGGKTVMDINHSADALTGYPRVCYVGYDDKALDFGFVIMSDKELVGSDDTGLWGEDQCEIFLSIDGENYGHLGVNVKGTLATELKGDLDWSLENAKAAASVSGIARYIEVSVPFAALNVKTPKSGDKWKINLNGHQTDGDMWIASNATYGGFHNPERFFTLTFE